MSEQESAAGWETISIRTGFKNYLKLRCAKENRTSPGNVLDTILKESGIPQLSEDELTQKMKEVAV